jgi:DNA-directed RNA polymerase subunit RPC12/RpoP
VLKKKALTAVLTAAFVLGIGGMVFEPSEAHAAQAVWRCYWCGKKATTYSDAKGYAYAPSRAGCEASSATRKWCWYYGHGWICETGGTAPTDKTVYVCRDCGRIHVTIGNVNPPQLKCDNYPDSYHRWTDRGIKLYGKVKINNNKI